MQDLCLRCTRKLLRGAVLYKRSQVSFICTRSYSNTASLQDDTRDSSMGVGTSQPRRPLADTGSKFGQFLDQAVQDNAQRPTGNSTPPGLLLRRTSTPSGGPRNPLIRRANQSERGPSQGAQVLRRTGPPRTGTPRTGARSGPGARQGQRPTQDRRRRRNEVFQDDEGDDDVDVEAMWRKIDPPVNPQESIVYEPKGTTIEELKADWPAIPLSGVGLAESVQQRIEWLARRIPHGYKSPTQLAERYQKGEMIRFESAEEKEKVLRIAKEMAKERAGRLTDRKGQETQPEDMSFSDISEQEKRTLAIDMVKGSYAEVEKQRMPFLDSVARSLRNNETYQGPEMAQFIGKIQSMLPSDAGAQRAGQQQKRAPVY